MQRRSLLKLGLAGAAVLTAVGGGLALVQPGWRHGRLTAAGREVFGAVAQAVLDGLLPVAGKERGAALEAHLVRMDATIGTLSAPARTELSQLLTMLHSAPGRLALAGLSQPWARASVPDVQSALQVMRLSRLDLRQQAYHALRNLTNAAWFSEPSTWRAMGYPGPRPLA